jgi:hypothetical protein
MSTIALTITSGSYDTYDTLTAAVPDYLDAQIDSAQVPGWVGLVEAEINRRLALDPVRPQLTRQTITLDAEYVTIPTDFQKDVSLEYVESDGTRHEIRFVDFTGLVDDVANPIPETWLFSANPDYTDKPEVAAIIDGEMRLFPVPDASYSGTFLYNAKLTAISDTNQQNWFLAAHSDVYLYGLLFHANAFLPDKETAAQWFDLFNSRLDQVLTSYPRTVVRRKLRSDAVYMADRQRRVLA